MESLVFICHPDKNGVYSIGDRYINLVQYKNPLSRFDNTIICPICDAYQIKSYEYVCGVCGYKYSFYSEENAEEFIKQNKEKIEELKKNYGRLY